MRKREASENIRRWAVANVAKLKEWFKAILRGQVSYTNNVIGKKSCG